MRRVTLQPWISPTETGKKKKKKKSDTENGSLCEKKTERGNRTLALEDPERERETGDLKEVMFQTRIS